MVQVERIDQDNRVDTVVDGQNEGKVVEDGGKDDMFVDCPDELVSYDGTHGRVSVADNSEETIGTNLNKPDNGKHGGELEPLQAMLGKSVAEKESFALEYEVYELILHSSFFPLTKFS